MDKIKSFTNDESSKLEVKRMKINPMVVQDNFQPIEEDRFVATLFTVTKSLNELIKECNQYLKGCEDKSIDPFEAGLDLLYNLAKIDQIDVSSIEIFGSKVLGSSPAIRKRPIDFQDYFSSAKKLIDQRLSSFVTFDAKELQTLLYKLKNAEGHLICLLLHSTDLFSFSSRRIKMHGYPTFITSGLNNYFKNQGISRDDWTEITDNLIALQEACRTDMGIFEKCPDLLEPFEDLVGEAFYDCVDLSKEDIQSVLSGKMSVEELLDMIELKDSEPLDADK